jgi:hypothetical protein
VDKNQLASLGLGYLAALTIPAAGTIDNCFGPKATESRCGPGSRLLYKHGDGNAKIRIDTKSGDVRLLAKGLRQPAALKPTA